MDLTAGKVLVEDHGTLWEYRVATLDGSSYAFIASDLTADDPSLRLVDGVLTLKQTSALIENPPVIVEPRPTAIGVRRLLADGAVVVQLSELPTSGAMAGEFYLDGTDLKLQTTS